MHIRSRVGIGVHFIKWREALINAVQMPWKHRFLKAGELQILVRPPGSIDAAAAGAAAGPALLLPGDDLHFCIALNNLDLSSAPFQKCVQSAFVCIYCLHPAHVSAHATEADGLLTGCLQPVQIRDLR